MNDSLILEITDATISQGEKVILEKVNFTLATAEFCYIIGKSGSGKSSFLKTIYGALPLGGGKARVDDIEISSISKKEIPTLRRKLGMVFQDFNLFLQWTVASNLRFILRATDWKDKEKIEERVEKVLADVGLLSKKDELAYTLSGGEQQRLVIARAILNNPKIIIADEPTGNLDPDTSDSILYLISRIATEHKTAVILATHDYRIIEKFPARVYKCVDGAIVEV